MGYELRTEVDLSCTQRWTPYAYGAKKPARCASRIRLMVGPNSLIDYQPRWDNYSTDPEVKDVA
ncbi:hypothetical protein BDN72DRAFT_841570 [Pluteus cervinus]|uniref:Uncharacterized protein n=1 Tax=Pluteus cervinus TaxID=181527 RepID=A0ACD3ART4_9AGAR|nr:hypothetical protein BDN72DRAFT_841570 [Pluteus cervinus]